jgi:hypothetical protein
MSKVFSLGTVELAHLPSKDEALSSNPSTAKKKKFSVFLGKGEEHNCFCLIPNTNVISDIHPVTTAPSQHTQEYFPSVQQSPDLPTEGSLE